MATTNPGPRGADAADVLSRLRSGERDEALIQRAIAVLSEPVGSTGASAGPPSHLQHIPIALMEWTPDRRLLWASGTERLVGYAATEIRADLHPPDVGPLVAEDHERLTPALAALFSGRSPTPEELACAEATATEFSDPARQGFVATVRLRHRNGSLVHCLAFHSVRVEPDGRVPSLMIYAIDITDQVTARRELDRANEALELHLDNSLLAIVEWGPDFRFRRWSRGAERIFGYTQEEMVGRPFDQLDPPLICPEDMPIAMAHVERLLSGRTTRDSIQSRNRCKDGRVLWIAWSSSSLFDDDGKLVSVLSHGVDVTDRVLAERKAADSLQRLELHIDNSPVAILEWSPEGTITRVSAGLERISGYSACELVGHSIFQMKLIHPEDMGRATGRMQAMMSGQMKRGTAVYRCVCKDGRLIHVQWSSSVLFDAAGRVLSVFSHGVDLTDRINAEAALRNAKEMAEAASKAKDRFIASLSHELRTPLTPAMMLLSGLQNDPRIPADARADLRVAHNNIADEARLIDDLLDLTRLARGELRIEPSDCTAHEVVRASIVNAQTSLQTKNLTLRDELEAGRDQVMADPRRLRQVVSNLLSNAIKFTPAGGTIWVKTRDTENMFELTVEDNGIGIASEHMPYIFEAFERGETRHRYEYTGLGLGLSIARDLMKRMGGTVLAHSDGLGRGARFVVTLPLVDSAAPVPAKVAPPPTPAPGAGGASLQGRAVLLVEDHSLSAELFKRLLGKCGCTIAVARSVGEAMSHRQALGRPYDLILSDIGLPDGTGHDLLRQLRGGGDATPAIALSGYGMAHDVANSLQAGFAMHLTKPVDTEALLTAIDGVLQCASPSRP